MLGIKANADGFYLHDDRFYANYFFPSYSLMAVGKQLCGALAPPTGM